MSTYVCMQMHQEKSQEALQTDCYVSLLWEAWIVSRGAGGHSQGLQANAAQPMVCKVIANLFNMWS